MGEMSTNISAGTAGENVDGTDEGWPDLWKRRCNDLNLAYITYRYHRKRQWFYEWLEKGSQAGSVLMGLSLMGKTVQDYLPLVAVGVSGLGLLALVFGYSQRRQEHKELAEQAMALVAKIESLPLARLDDKEEAAWQEEMAALNRREPPNLRTLVSVCEREQAIVDGHPDHVPPVPWWRRLHSHFF